MNSARKLKSTKTQLASTLGKWQHNFISKRNLYICHSTEVMKVPDCQCGNANNKSLFRDLLETEIACCQRSDDAAR